jgi:multiple sugar transport system permease protein
MSFAKPARGKAGRKAARGRHGVVQGQTLRLGTFVRFSVIGVFALFLLAPMYWVVVTSIKPTSDYLQTPPVWFPDHPTSLHFSTALNEMRGWEGLENSLIVAICVTILAVTIGACAGYSMARFQTGGMHFAFWVMSQRFLPPIAVVIPIFFLYRNAQDWFGITLFDTRFGLVLLYTVFVLPFTIWMMYAYFRQSPVELEEAALVDGCSRWQSLWKVAWPMAMPGVISAGAFAFIFSFTEFLFALILTSQNAVTLPVAIASMTTSFQGALYGETSALTIVSFVPAIVLGLLVQKHLVRGLTLGAVEG